MARSAAELAHVAERVWPLANVVLVAPPVRCRLLFRTIHDVALMIDRE